VVPAPRTARDLAALELHHQAPYVASLRITLDHGAVWQSYSCASANGVSRHKTLHHLVGNDGLAELQQDLAEKVATHRKRLPVVGERGELLWMRIERGQRLPQGRYRV